jgi:hypothetical protein
MESIEYIQPNTTMLQHISAIIEQNALVLRMNCDLMKMLTAIQLVASPIRNGE